MPKQAKRSFNNWCASYKGGVDTGRQGMNSSTGPFHCVKLQKAHHRHWDSPSRKAQPRKCGAQLWISENSENEKPLCHYKKQQWVLG